jgi:hypothetical protein
MTRAEDFDIDSAEAAALFKREHRRLSRAGLCSATPNHACKCGLTCAMWRFDHPRQAARLERSGGIRYRTDSQGRSRVLCQEVTRHGVSYYRPKGSPCIRYAVARKGDGEGIFVCASHADPPPPMACLREARILQALSRGRPPLEPAVIAQLREVCGCGVCKNEIAREARCPKCGCTAHKPCVLSLPDGAGTGNCAPAGSQPWLETCSACLTPELRGAEAKSSGGAKAERSRLRNTVGNGDHLVTAEVGMCFRVYFAWEPLATARRHDLVQDRRFTRRRYAHLFALDVRRQGGEAEIRYERSRRFEPNDRPSERAWVKGPVVPG